MKTRADMWKLRQAQQRAQQQVLIRMPSPQNTKSKELANEKVTPKQTSAPDEKRKDVLTNFAIPPVFSKPDAKRRAAELDPLEMEAIRNEALIYTRPFDGEEERSI